MSTKSRSTACIPPQNPPRTRRNEAHSSEAPALWPFLVLAIAVGIAALLVPRTPQPLSYHHFADQRTWLGVPNFGDVVSNLLFLLAGVLGLVFLFGKSSHGQFLDPRERWPYVFVFVGIVSMKKQPIRTAVKAIAGIAGIVWLATPVAPWNGLIAFAVSSFVMLGCFVAQAVLDD